METLHWKTMARLRGTN